MPFKCPYPKCNGTSIDSGMQLCPDCFQEVKQCANPECGQFSRIDAPRCIYCLTWFEQNEIKKEVIDKETSKQDILAHTRTEAGGSTKIGTTEKTAAGDYIEGNVTNVYGESDSVTKTGKKCPIKKCRELVKDDYFDCDRCGRDYIHNHHKRDDPTEDEEYGVVCEECHEIMLLIVDGETALDNREFKKAKNVLRKARTKANRKVDPDPDLNRIEDLLKDVDRCEKEKEDEETVRLLKGEYCKGDVIAGRFDVQKKLGEGGMGRVFLVRDRNMENQLFALKYILPELAAAPGGIERLQKEAKNLDHLSDYTNIVRFYDLYNDGGRYFMKMEFADGGTLEQKMLDREVEENPYTPEEILPWLEGIARGLDHAHGQEPPLVHRDLKPANIIFNGKGAPKILDFGIAKVLKTTMSKTTLSSASAGTVLYMSPEQIKRPRDICPQSDIYALGCIVYELLSGYPPFDAAVAHNSHVDTPPEPLEDVKKRVNEVVLRAMAKNPKNRFASAREFFESFREAATQPDFATCPVCGKAEDVERFICPDCGTEEVCVTHRSKAGLCPECEKKRLAEEKRIAEEKRKEAERKAAEEARIAAAKKAEQERLAAEKKRKEEEERKRSATPGYLTNGPLPRMKFAYIPAGSFMMGSPDSDEDSYSDEKPQHKVTLDAFRMMTTPVTQAMWEKVMGENPSDFKGDSTRPVENVSWDDIQEFLKKLNAMDRGKGYRLPTEAEWEYACRAGTTTKYWSGDSESDLARVGWYDKNSDDTTHPVGKKPANPWGLYDMHGNVWEWCEDWFDDDYYQRSPEKNPQGPDSGESRVLRGGSWCGGFRNCRAACRFWYLPLDRDDDYGFRVVGSA